MGWNVYWWNAKYTRKDLTSITDTLSVIIGTVFNAKQCSLAVLNEHVNSAIIPRIKVVQGPVSDHFVISRDKTESSNKTDNDITRPQRWPRARSKR